MGLLQRNLIAAWGIVFILLLRKLAAKRLPGRLWTSLWLLVVLRLLLPFPGIYALPKALQNVIPPNAAWEQEENPAADTAFSETVSERDSQLFDLAEASAGFSESFTPDGNVLLKSIYVLGALFMGSCLSYGMYRDYRQVRDALLIRDKKLKALLLSHMKPRSLYRNVRLLVSDKIHSPLTCGIIRPRIILPKILDKSRDKELSFILEHEIQHIKYGDCVVKCLAAFCLCICWFNPLVWVMKRLLYQDMELACDQAVLQKNGRKERAAYALTLLSIAEKEALPGIISSGFGKNAMKERIEAIMKYKKLTAGCISAAAIIFAAGMGLCLTDFSAKASAGSEEAYMGYENSYAVTEENAAETDASESSGIAQEAGDEQDIDSSWLEEYVAYGIQYEKQQLYYKGKKIFFFADNRSGEEGHFYGSVLFQNQGRESGTTGVITQRDKSGKLVGVKQLSEKESAKYARTYWDG